MGELILFQINIMFVGQLQDTNQIAGMGQANAFIWSVPFTITFGVTSVLETLVSQAYGSKQYALCGTYLNRQIFLMTCVFIPISVVCFNAETILVNTFGQD